MGETHSDVYDVIVIGAGINGLGVARDAAERGLSVALIEQEDLCFGVSAWSGRLVHGGLRYLERGDIPLVRESLRERERLFRVAPHLVKPVRLLMPFYSRNTRPSWMIRLGMIAYDLLSIDKSVASHRILSRDNALARFSGMAHSGLSGAALFTDGQVEYAERLCVELAVAARDAGADIRLHCRATGFVKDGDRVTGVNYQLKDGSHGSVAGRLVINAAGPWVDRVLSAESAKTSVAAQRRIGGAKGSHIIVDPFPGAPSDVVYYESQTDGRLVLVIPWMGRYLIGCTDIKFDDEPDSARAESDEISYLLTEVNALVPGARLTEDDILYTYSGVRPLPYAPDVPEWKVPRSHVLADHAAEGARGLISVIGGKLTTYRQLAEDVVDTAERTLRGRVSKPVSKNAPFPGAQTDDLDGYLATLAADSRTDAASAARLGALYGTRADDVLRLVDAEPALAEKFDPGSDAIAAELIFAVTEELAQTLTDVFARRILLAFEPGHGLQGVERAADIIGERLGWSAERAAAEIDEYRAWLDHLRVPSRV